MTQGAPLLLILTSSLLTCTAAGASIRCAWTKVLPSGEVHRSFLREGALSVRLYHSTWSGQRALLSCAWSEDAAVIRDYLSKCRERTKDFPDSPGEDVQVLLEKEDLCVPAASGRQVRSVDEVQRSEVRSHHRVKRGFIVPGTLWCGAGNKAPSYKDLGVFAETDRCCRKHDHCKHTILSFHSDFGVFNSNIFTLSHCDCDKKFRRCLMKANDAISDAVGYTFFNLLKMQCFDLTHQLQCKSRNWFGMCKETEMALYAEVRPPTAYESPNSTDTSTTAPEKPTGPPDSSDKRLSCAAYKDLDQCTDKILPQQEKYGLHNSETTTLYHCSCTTRLFQTLAKQRHLTEVQAHLMGGVSRSCFLPQDCTSGQTCAAVLVKTDLPQPDRSGADVEQQRHLQAVSLKVRRPNGRRNKRRDGAVSLHKLCARMIRPKLSRDQQLQTELVQM